MDFERPLFDLEKKLEDLRRLSLAEAPELAAEVDSLAAEIAKLRIETYTRLSPWDRVQIARHPERPKTQHYVEALFTDVIELHGDRLFGDDEAMFAGLATLGEQRIAFLGHRKGSNTTENIRRHFGSPHPEGFRKAMRVMRLAEKFGLPLVTFLDTFGAYPGIEAEERGQAWAIAESIELLSGLRVPIVVADIGEGGSGGALAIGFGDHLIMLENSYYSVSSPEACASILYRDSGQAEAASSCLRMTARDVYEFGIADEIIPEPLGGAHRDPSGVISAVGVAISDALDRLSGTLPEDLFVRRYDRLRDIGEYCRLPGE
ncbi:MAG: acetyl-CoA carboxylase carboxyltransferase subunit alpha [Coriobacteriia bacterium]|nr:acetyl-CoA carboxylase carboxyltransferase subunit alpha [Coriobacteriia bacterium]